VTIDPTFAALCPAATTRPVATTVAGTLTIGAQNQWTSTIAGEVTAEITFPTSCVPNAPPFPPAVLCPAVQGQIPGAEVCAAAAGGGGCTCTVTTPYSNVTVGGLVTTGGVATVNGSDTYHYCVDGDVLRYREFDSAGTSHPVVVLSRQ
jgi:hypothetical protein